jgi:hypothetical protein
MSCVLQMNQLRVISDDSVTLANQVIQAVRNPFFFYHTISTVLTFHCSVDRTTRRAL